MSMQAGEIYIDVAAKIGKLEQGLEQAKTVSMKAGEEAGQRYSVSFKDKFESYAQQQIGKLAGPAIAERLASAAAGVLRSDKAMPDAILDALKSMPFIGAFVDLGSAIYDATFGAADKAAEDLIDKASKARDGMLRAAGQRQAEENASNARRADLMIENRKLDIEQQVADIRASGDERSTVVAEARAKAEQLYMQHQLAMANDISDSERQLMEERHARQLQLIETEAQAKLDKLDEQAAKEAEAEAKRLEADQQRAAKEAEAIASKAEAAQDEVRRKEIELRYAREAAGATEETEAKAAAARDASLRGLEKEKALRAAQSDEERKAIEQRYALEEQIAGLASTKAEAADKANMDAASAQTALGAFSFDPYPKLMQRQLDERTTKAVEKIAANQGTGGFT